MKIKATNNTPAVHLGRYLKCILSWIISVNFRSLRRNPCLIQYRVLSCDGNIHYTAITISFVRTSKVLDNADECFALEFARIKKGFSKSYESVTKFTDWRGLRRRDTARAPLTMSVQSGHGVCSIYESTSHRARVRIVQFDISLTSASGGKYD